MDVSQCYSGSWKFPKQFNYQKQQLSVARVWTSWQPGNSVSCFQLVSGWLPSQDGSNLLWGHIPVPRESFVGLDVAKSPPVAWSKHARSDWDQVSMLASPYGWWSPAGGIPEPPRHDEVEPCRPWRWTGSDCTSARSNVNVQDIIPVAYTGHHAYHHDVWVCSSTSADTSPHLDRASAIAVMFRDIGILKSLPTSSPHSSTSICKVKTVHWLIGEEYRIPIVISPVDVIVCPVQTRLFVQSVQGNANACSPRPKTTLPKTVTNCLRGNVNSNSTHELIS